MQADDQRTKGEDMAGTGAYPSNPLQYHQYPYSYTAEFPGSYFDKQSERSYETNGNDRWFMATTPGGSAIMAGIEYNGLALSGMPATETTAFHAMTYPHYENINLNKEQLHPTRTQYQPPQTYHYTIEHPTYEGHSNEVQSYFLRSCTSQADMSNSPPAMCASPTEQSEDESEHPGSPSEHADEDTEAGHNKPYAQLIYQALMSAPQHSMVLSEIYEYFRQNFPKFRRMKGKGWMNSIRHNLSMNGAFLKLERPEGDQGKGYIWQLAPEAVKNGVRSTTRFRKQNNNNSKKRERDGEEGHKLPLQGGKRVRKDSTHAHSQSRSSTEASDFYSESRDVSMGPPYQLPNYSSTGNIKTSPLHVPDSLDAFDLHGGVYTHHQPQFTLSTDSVHPVRMKQDPHEVHDLFYSRQDSQSNATIWQEGALEEAIPEEARFIDGMTMFNRTHN